MANAAETIHRIQPPGWMIQPQMRAIMAALMADGLPARFVGGCVRDAILGLAPADIDIATPAAPERVQKLLKRAGIKAIPTGIDHGTVTAVLPPVQCEITTLRRDIDTDGRHAVVQFGTDWAEDAARRDFTINALYGDGDGGIFDPTGQGLEDLRAGRVRFIGDAEQRVREDYLRALRFFRFHARFASGAPDAAALAACRSAVPGMARLSAERVSAELIKLMALPKAAPALAAMQECGLLAALLPEARLDLPALERLIALQQQLGGAELADPEDPWPRFSLLLGEGWEAAADRLKLSNAQRKRLEDLAQPLDWAAFADPEGRAALYYDHGAPICRDRALLAATRDSGGAGTGRTADSGPDQGPGQGADLGPDRGPDRGADRGLAAGPGQGAELAARAAALPGLLETMRDWRKPVFPLRGADLLAHGLRHGPGLGGMLKELEAWWRQDGCRADREACLAHLRQRVVIEESELPLPKEAKAEAKPPKA